MAASTLRTSRAGDPGAPLLRNRIPRPPQPRRGRVPPRQQTSERLKRMALDILVVDDEQDIRDLVSGVLEDEGYAARTAANSAEALQELGDRRPSLVLHDVWLQRRHQRRPRHTEAGCGGREPGADRRPGGCRQGSRGAAAP